ncbi:hypothetical protein LOZ58_003221 [Ophidiomyces ophidiicola]|nr:hypothetical protein LOZ65_002483 [Ophidiomyces ophidiicola]KAI1961367.1 hypothetical protein LOZ58_003221 [Ophidiomyces ophidiicola]
MGKAGRVACIFTPYMLSIATLVCLVLVALGSTKPSAPLNEIYFFKANLKDINTNPRNLDKSLIPLQKGLQLAKSSNKLREEYIVGLYNHCSGNVDGSNYQCSERKSKYWFDPVEVWGLGDTVKNYYPKGLADGLNAYKKVAKWLFIAYAISIAASVVQLLVGISAIFSRWGSFATTIFAAATALCTIAASVTASALYSIVSGAVTVGLEPFNISASMGARMFAITWLASLFAFSGCVFWMCSVCCCSGRSPYDHKTKSKDGIDAEKAPYSYERVSSPYTGNNMGGSSVPLNPMPPSHGPAYEPYRGDHRA